MFGAKLPRVEYWADLVAPALVQRNDPFASPVVEPEVDCPNVLAIPPSPGIGDRVLGDRGSFSENDP